jgi:hypothetical protein
MKKLPPNEPTRRKVAEIREMWKKGYTTCRDAAERFGVLPTVTHAWIKQFNLKSIKVGRRRYIDVADLCRVMGVEAADYFGVDPQKDFTTGPPTQASLLKTPRWISKTSRRAQVIDMFENGWITPRHFRECVGVQPATVWRWRKEYDFDVVWIMNRVYISIESILDKMPQIDPERLKIPPK